MKTKNCGECRFFLAPNHWACQRRRSHEISYDSEICFQFAFPTVGDTIRLSSDEELAEMLVYPVKPINFNGHISYEFTSCLLLGRSYSMRDQAVFLTERRLNAPAKGEESEVKDKDEKDKEIESLKVELDNLRHFCDSIFEMAKRNNGVLHFRQDSGTWKIETERD